MMNLILTVALATSKPVLPSQKQKIEAERTPVIYNDNDSEKYRRMIYWQSLKTK